MTLIVGFVLATLALAYAGALLWLWSGFRRMAGLTTTIDSSQSRPTISVVIPARNEARSIQDCLGAVFENDYDRFEVIVADDGSTDGTRSVVESFRTAKDLRHRLRLVSNTSSAGKKAALTEAIRQSRGEIVVSTDADTNPPPRWLKTMVRGFDDPEVEMVIGPVTYPSSGSFIDRVLALELLGLVATTAGGIAHGRPNMCNGANLAYRRSAFDRVGGFSGIEDVASGDDAFLMFKIVDDSGARAVAFCPDPEALVVTSAPEGWHAILNQRLRWASKSTEYRDAGVVSLAAVVLAFHVALVAAFTVLPFAAGVSAFLVSALVIKFAAEGVLLSSACRHFGRSGLMRLFLPAQIVQIPYVAVVGVLGLLGIGFDWKGRRHTR